MAVDFTRHSQYAGINLVDCLISVNPGGVIAGTRKPENIHIENTLCQRRQVGRKRRREIALRRRMDSHSSVFIDYSPGRESHQRRPIHG